MAHYHHYHHWHHNPVGPSNPMNPIYHRHHNETNEVYKTYTEIDSTSVTDARLNHDKDLQASGIFFIVMVCFSIFMVWFHTRDCNDPVKRNR